MLTVTKAAANLRARGVLRVPRFQWLDLLLLLAVLLLTAPSWLAWLEPAPFWYDVPDAGYLIENAPVAPGQQPQNTFRRCNYTRSPLPVTAENRLENVDTNVTYARPEIAGVLPVGCASGTSRGIALPADLPLGHYRILAVVHARGMWRVHTQALHSQPFEVRAAS